MAIKRVNKLAGKAVYECMLNDSRLHLANIQSSSHLFPFPFLQREVNDPNAVSNSIYIGPKQVLYVHADSA